MQKSYTTSILAAAGLYLLASYGQVTAQQKRPTQTPRTPFLYESQFKGDLHTIKFIPGLLVNGKCLDRRLDEYAKKGVAVYALLFDENNMLSTLSIKPKSLGQKDEEEIRKVAKTCGIRNGNNKKNN